MLHTTRLNITLNPRYILLLHLSYLKFILLEFMSKLFKMYTVKLKINELNAFAQEHEYNHKIK